MLSTCPGHLLHLLGEVEIPTNRGRDQNRNRGDASTIGLKKLYCIDLVQAEIVRREEEERRRRVSFLRRMLQRRKSFLTLAVEFAPETVEMALAGLHYLEMEVRIGPTNV